MALVNRVSRFGSPATNNPQDNSYQTSLFEERAGSLSTLSGFSSNNAGKVPGTFVPLSSVEEPTTTTTTTSTTSTTTTEEPTTTTSTTTTTTTV